jgi:hypothetical protein
MNTKLTAKDDAQLRELAREAWEAELTGALEELFERFCEWTEDGMSAFDLTEQIPSSTPRSRSFVACKRTKTDGPCGLSCRR